MTRKILAATVLFAITLTAQALDPPSLANESGAELFQRFCASCHGESATGNGPAAAALSQPVPDLTALSKNAGGEFPANRVLEVIDGRAVLPAHGSRPMPVWGYEFEAQVTSGEPGREAAQTLIERLVEYLETIQK